MHNFRILTHNYLPNLTTIFSSYIIKNHVASYGPAHLQLLITPSHLNLIIFEHSKFFFNFFPYNFQTDLQIFLLLKQNKKSTFLVNISLQEKVINSLKAFSEFYILLFAFWS